MTTTERKSHSKRRAEKLAEETRAKALKVPIETLAWVAKVSDKTITEYRGGKTPRLSTMEKIAEAVAKIKSGVKIKDAPGPLRLDSKKKWEGQTTVKAIFGGRRCGWCGEYHGERLRCDAT